MTKPRNYKTRTGNGHVLRCLHPDCRKPINQHKAWRGKVCQECKESYIAGVKAGAITAPHKIDCPQCKAIDVPAIHNQQKYCDPDLTERSCKEEAKKDSNARYRAGRAEAVPVYLPKKQRSPTFDRLKVCHTPGPCQWYSEGYGCPNGIVPCSDRLDGELWEHDANGGQRCWKLGTYPKSGGYSLCALGHTNVVLSPGGAGGGHVFTG